METKAVQIIREMIERQGITLVKIILFGSRARGDFQEDSDWDFFVVVDRRLSFQEKANIISEIKWKLAEFKIPNDIILKYEGDFNRLKEYPGNFSFYAFREGVEV